MLENYRNVTVSNGTMQENDLIEAFFPVLHDLANEQEGKDKRETIDLCSIIESTVALIQACKDLEVDLSVNQQEIVSSLVYDIFDYLNTYAPEGCYFGSIEGNGSCFGFWECDPENNL